MSYLFYFIFILNAVTCKKRHIGRLGCSCRPHLMDGLISECNFQIVNVFDDCFDNVLYWCNNVNLALAVNLAWGRYLWGWMHLTFELCWVCFEDKELFDYIYCKVCNLDGL